MSRFVSTILRGGKIAGGSPVVLARDIRGRVLLEDTDDTAVVLSADSAVLTRDMMRLVVDSGTAGAVRGAAGRPGYYGETIGKTGTTDSEKDLWLVGGTTYYSAGLWLGYDQPSRIGGSSSDLAAPLWGWWARAVHEHFELVPLPGPENRRRKICNVSGHRVNSSCSGLRAPFLEGTEPRSVCSIEHPPPDPDKPKYKGMWARKRESEEKAAAAREAASRTIDDDQYPGSSAPVQPSASPEDSTQ